MVLNDTKRTDYIQNRVTRHDLNELLHSESILYCTVYCTVMYCILLQCTLPASPARTSLPWHRPVGSEGLPDRPPPNERERERGGEKEREREK